MHNHHTSSDELLSFSQQQEIDRLCSEFEQQWCAREHPRIEDYLSKVATPLRDPLLAELIAAEVDLRRGAGEGVQIDEYRQRFPDDRAAVEAGWAMIANRSQPSAGPASTKDFSRDHDLDTGGDQADAHSEPPLPIPDMIGRYKILRELGEGGFGRVFLAHDTQLQRDVAVKVPGSKRLASAKSIDAFVQEARTAARLKHPALVTVYDIQQDRDDVYIVQEFIDGQDLSHWVRVNDPSPERIVALLKEVVEAVGFAHQHDLVHRDLKPANLLVDRKGHPHVADFGLALNESVQRLRKGEVCGTPAYMSPEQVRGLTHVLDGRSDLWSIGVILYELLTGRRPFGGANHSEVFEEVKRRHPKPPRQIKPEIPAELERICLKCLAKRQTDRYASAAELLDDLEAWSRLPPTVVVGARPAGEQPVDTAGTPTPQSPQAAGSTATPSDTKSDRQQVPRIVPKGLRSFDEHDADFFLELLPGPPGRDGLPESIRFWKLRIEETDPDETFRVGLIYGPSGCGKSSLVKAGLLPRLAPHVVPVYLEAAPEDTELRLLKGLRRRFATIPDDVALPDVLAGIREGSWVPENAKVCVVLDQFEQWLHARRGEQGTQLVQALLHCDGGRLQSVALVRDDFWVAASRFMQDLEIRLLEGGNSALIDLFDPLHARKVLAAFGRAYGMLPEGLADLSKEQESFLDRAVEGLAQDGKIICVRLALFADMLKGKPWTTTTLSRVGGTEGLGVTFLEETFSASTAPAAHRHHQKAAQAVLQALLPEAGSDIRGNRRPYEALLDTSGYAQRPNEFGDLIQILDSEIRLITPTVPVGEDVEVHAPADATEPAAPTVEPTAQQEKYYQLTHDYLVPSLRDWLTRKQKETRKGRAELRLAERAALWNAKPENRRLPALWEYVNIRLFTRKRGWTDPQCAMMRSAGRHHGSLWGAGLVLALVFGVVAQQYVAATRLRNDTLRAESLVEAVLTAPADAVPYAIQNLEPLRKHMIPVLERQYEDDQLPWSQRLHAALALAAFGRAEPDFLVESIAAAEPDECGNLLAALRVEKEAALQGLLQQAERAEKNKDWPQKARLAITALHLGESALAWDMLQVSRRPDPVERTVFIQTFANWHGKLSELWNVLESDPLLCDGQVCAFRSGMCCALSTISVAALTPEERDTYKGILLTWYHEEPDAGVHAAVKHLLGQWRFELPPVKRAMEPEGTCQWYVNTLGMTMVMVPAGEFTMSSWRGPRVAGQTVRIDEPFWLGMHEVTVGQFREFIKDESNTYKKHWGGFLPVAWQQTDDDPVVNVSWDDACAFCVWLSKKEGKSYRLPTEAQWEHACRAGSETKFTFGDDDRDLAMYGWFVANSSSQAQPVGRKLPNGWGLFDMHGNAWEWCRDNLLWYDALNYSEELVHPDHPGWAKRAGAANEATAPKEAPRGLRGGGWPNGPADCRSASREGGAKPYTTGAFIGFRVARDPEQSSK